MTGSSRAGMSAGVIDLDLFEECTDRGQARPWITGRAILKGDIVPFYGEIRAQDGNFPIDSMILAMGIFYGGLGQIIAGIMCFMRGDTFGTTAFTLTAYSG